MRRYWFAAAAAAAIGALLTAFPASAATVDVLTSGATGANGGTNVTAGNPGGDTIGASLASGTNATFAQVGGSTVVTCTSSTFSARVVTNPADPGTANLDTVNLSFSGCTVNAPGNPSVTVKVQNTPYNASVTTTSSSNGTGTVTISAGSAGAIQTEVDVPIFFGTAKCVYQVAAGNGNVNGTASNAGPPVNNISFSGQTFNKTSGPTPPCVSSANFSATYAPVVDQSRSGNPAVFTNP